MFDLQALGLPSRSDTRLHLHDGEELSQRTYPQVNAHDPHHSVSHHEKQRGEDRHVDPNPDLSRRDVRYYLEKLRNTPDGDGSLPTTP